MKRIDALAVLEEVATSLKESAESMTVVSSYDEGRLTGYYEALSTLMSQCAIIGIEPGDIGLDGFRPESILRGAKQAQAV